jgi:DNA excision repair protein ERCC-4
VSDFLKSSWTPLLTRLSLESQANTSGDAELALALSLEASLPPDEAEFEPFYGLLAPAQTVVVRAYTDDGDDRLLAELQPRFIVMYEPNQDFIRRIEVRFIYPLWVAISKLARRYTKP